MVTRNSQIRPIPLEIKAGVHPSTDSTALATDHWVMSQGIRMFNGIPRKIGGNVSLKFTNEQTIRGIIRSIYSTIFDAGVPRLIVGTNEHLYNIIGTEVENITPFVTTPNTLTGVATNYSALGSNPLSTVSGSNVVTAIDPNFALFQVGDVVTYSGATALNGVSAALLNAPHVIRSMTSNGYTFQVNDPATGTGSGGGTINRGSGLLRLTFPAHEQENGDRVKTENITALGGITAPQANSEFIIRNVTTNTFDVMTMGTSTSAASNVSGRYYPEIPPGPSTEFIRTGYGAGLYGEGLYGASGVSTISRVTPRIWYFDKFGEKVLASPGDQIYLWDGTNIAAPIPLAGAPTGINYFFVSDNILVTLGAGGIGNHVFASDQGDASNFVASSENQVFEDYIEGAAPLISHAAVTGQNLIFSNNQTYTFRYIGYEAGVWQIKLLDGNVGIISPLARVTVKGTAYWMGTNNFYMYRGGQVEIIPANTQSFTTLLNYVFENINRDQDSKCFAEYISKYNEVWFHYPTADSDEPNAVARLSLTDFSWVPDKMNRTAGEQSSNYFNVPHLANQQTVYQHEVGVNDDGQPLAWSITTNQRSGGKDSTTIVNLVPNSIQTEDINIRVVDHEWPTSPKAQYDRNFIFSTSTTHIPLEINGHFWQYTVSGDVLDQQFSMGQWYEYIQGGPPA